MQAIYLSFSDAIKDTLSIIPFLCLIFFAIEVIEHFYYDKILACINFSNKNTFKKGILCKIGIGPFLGAILAAIPQCGLSVIASTLYCKQMVSKGTLIAVYLATSDEAIPVLISNPAGYKTVLPLLTVKIITALIAGYLIDFIIPSKKYSKKEDEHIHIEKGCHSHNISAAGKKETFKELVFHPFVHTLSVAFFVFLITFIINLIFSYFALHQFAFEGLQNKFLEPVFTAIIGIIPNCAVSVGITVMYLKGAISFASCVSGLCAGAGLGILVLIKKNDDKKDTLLIILLLLVISIFAGLITAFAAAFL